MIKRGLWFSEGGRCINNNCMEDSTFLQWRDMQRSCENKIANWHTCFGLHVFQIRTARENFHVSVLSKPCTSEFSSSTPLCVNYYRFFQILLSAVQ